MSIEAMKQARDLLLAYQNMGDFRVANNCLSTVHALTKAIEQAEKQDADEWYEKALWGEKQEPVAYLMDGELFTAAEYQAIAEQGDGAQPLYAASIRKEWVGLDDNEIQDTEHFCGDVFEFARAIEAKLKEKNT